jgi:hypothetical protein
MTIPNIRNALENALATIAPAIDIVHENEKYEPIAGRPYAEAFLLVAMPSNPTMGDGFYQELGILQVNLQYPTETGTADAAARAELIRSLLKRGSTFSYAGVTVQIDRTPEISGGAVEADRWKLIVRARWHSDIYI